MVMYDNEFKTKGNNILTKDKIEPQHIYIIYIILAFITVDVMSYKILST